MCICCQPLCIVYMSMFCWHACYLSKIWVYRRSILVYPDQIPGNCSGSVGREFDCGGGNCISVEKVRDCVEDCPDGSDEGFFLIFMFRRTGWTFIQCIHYLFCSRFHGLTEFCFHRSLFILLTLIFKVSQTAWMRYSRFFAGKNARIITTTKQCSWCVRT